MVTFSALNQSAQPGPAFPGIPYKRFSTEQWTGSKTHTHERFAKTTNADQLGVLAPHTKHPATVTKMASWELPVIESMPG